MAAGCSKYAWISSLRREILKGATGMELSVALYDVIWGAPFIIALGPQNSLNVSSLDGVFQPNSVTLTKLPSEPHDRAV